MIHSVKFTCVLDTNVVYPIEVRDLLFWFAHYELYTPKWSAHIFDEWKEVMARNNVSEEEIIKRVEKAQMAFPDALVKNYEPLIDSLNLPDLKDRHVLQPLLKRMPMFLSRIIKRIFRQKYWKPMEFRQKVLMIF